MDFPYENGGPNAFSTLKSVNMMKYEQTMDGQWARKHITSDITMISQGHEDSPVVVYDDPGVDNKNPDEFSCWNQGSALKAIFIRLLLIAHNVLAVWRVVEIYDNNYYWLLAAMNFLLLVEGVVVIARRRGMDYKWWCPCFLIYLSTTIPSLWILTLYQYHPPDDVNQPQSPGLINGTLPERIFADNKTATIAMSTQVPNVTISSSISLLNSTLASTEATTAESEMINLSNLASLSVETWVILLQEALVYLLVFCRWLLPKEDSKEEVAVLLLEFLAIASDIMEFLAVFDEDKVTESLGLTYAVMAIWSLSFFQFVPSLTVRPGRFRHVKNERVKHIFRFFGEQFIEIFGLCMAISLQDGPFLVMRLYIMITLDVFTYSLVFFVLKNIVTVLLLTYRLAILSYGLPCCLRIRKKNKFNEAIEPNNAYETKAFA